MQKKGMNLIIPAIVLIAFLVVGIYLFVQKGNADNEGTVCTQDVFECEDGSFVSRNQDNNCEFNACPTNAGGTFPEGTETQTHELEISGFAFAPEELTIQVGDTVIWTNMDSIAHTVTSDTGNELASEYLGKGETYSHTFNTVGNFDYHCIPHPSMVGTITVE